MQCRILPAVAVMPAIVIADVTVEIGVAADLIYSMKNQ